MSFPKLPSSIRLVEVGLRDGLQSVNQHLETSDKVELVTMLIEAGVKEIEAVSFAHPKVLPQLADAAAVMDKVPRKPDIIYRGLAPNLRGAQRALESGLDEIVVVVSADEEISLRNQRMSVTEMLAELEKIGALVETTDTRLIVAIACAFFAPARGPVSAQERLHVLKAASDAGAHGVYLAATSGQEHPKEIYTGVEEARRLYPHLDIGVHLHNRNGFAPANAISAMSAGATWLEGSFAGLGGDLWFPGDPSVLGNAAMEDLVHLCDSLEIETGIDLEKYRRVSDYVVELTNRPSSSYVSRGGTRQELASAHWPEHEENKD